MMGNPLALLGLLAIAVPILIHLLGRHQSRIERFPTLRFIGTSRLSPTRRKRISDWPLLLVRMAIIAAAAIALAQPLFRDTAPPAAEVSRVVIVDTSASVDVARARALADSVSAGVTVSRIETGDPSAAVDGAVAWLETRPGLREIALVSDFQRSSIEEPVIPDGIGLTLIPAPLVASVARGRRDDIAVYAGPGDVAGAIAAWRAVGLPLPTDSAGRVAIIYRGYPAAEFLINTAVPVDSPWMARIVATLQRDRALDLAASSSPARPWPRQAIGAIGPSADPAIVPGRNGDRLSLFVRADAGSLASAALNQALIRALSPPPLGSELDSSRWAAADLARWQRAARPAPGAPSDASDGRLFWALALVLIGLERWMRSRSRGSQLSDLPVTQERAA